MKKKVLLIAAIGFCLIMPAVSNLTPAFAQTQKNHRTQFFPYHTTGRAFGQGLYKLGAKG